MSDGFYCSGHISRTEIAQVYHGEERCDIPSCHRKAKWRVVG